MRKIYIFLLVNFLITWGAWGIVIAVNKAPLTPENSMYLLYGLGGLLGPVIGAFVAQRLCGTRDEFKSFLNQMMKAKVHFGWYIAIVALPFVLSIIPYTVEWIFTGAFVFRFETAYYSVFMMLPMMIVGGGLEELGWRGVLLPELLKKVSGMTATLMLAPIWALWHAPLWYIEGTVQNGSSFGLFVLSLLCSAFLLSAVYIRTKSILLCVLLHALLNANSAYFAASVSFGTWSVAVNVIIQLTLCVGAFLLLDNKRPRLQAKTAIAS